MAGPAQAQGQAQGQTRQAPLTIYRPAAGGYIGATFKPES